MESPRMEWVKARAAELIDLFASFGATEVSLCGSVACGCDHDKSDLDFYVGQFDEGDPESIEDESDAAKRANALVKAVRAFSPYGADVHPLPGWPSEPPYGDHAIALADLLS